ncbi:hypothetical protein D3C77_562640 [compost metagenome]
MNDPVHCGELNDMSVLVVNFSTVQQGAYHDPACIVQAGCHPFITHESYVLYRGATVLRVPRLDAKILTGEVRPDVPVSRVVYDQVRAGFDVSDMVSPKISRYLRRHGI